MQTTATLPRQPRREAELAVQFQPGRELQPGLPGSAGILCIAAPPQFADSPPDEVGVISDINNCFVNLIFL